MLSADGVTQVESKLKLAIPAILLLVGLLLLVAVSTGQANEGELMSEEQSNTSVRGGIILMRHGEAEHNVENRYNSAPDHPAYEVRHLTPLGKEQARQSADELQAKGITGESICRVLVSPLPRTQETTDIVTGKLQVASSRKKTVDELIESQIGERENKLISDYNDRDFWFPDNPENFGGETYAQVEQRVLRVLKSIINDPDCDLNTQYVLLVSHGVPVYIMQDLLTGAGEKISPASYRIIHNPAIIKN